jgi:hypothetical protein
MVESADYLSNHLVRLRPEEFSAVRGRLKRVSCNERIGFSTPLLKERIRVSEIGRDFSNVL